MLVVSRPYIAIDQIEEFPVETRFIKLPIQRYLELMEIETNRPQNAVINAINDPRHRFITACISRRVGKTFIANVIGSLITLMPGSSVLIIAPNYTLAGISWDLQRDFKKKFAIETVRDNAKDRVIEFTNGSFIRMAAISQVDSAVGRSYDLIIFDESAISPDGADAFNIRLRPTLDKLNSKALFISTPRGNNWFKDFFDRGFDSRYPSWVSIHADYHENPRVNLSDIEEAKETMSKSEFEQEYLAKFTSLEGQIYHIDDTCITEIEYIDPELIKVHGEEIRIREIIMGMDVGFRDPTAICVVATDWNRFYVLEDMQFSEADTSFAAARATDFVDKYKADFVYIDSASAQLRYDFAYLYDLPSVSAKKDVLPGISYVQSIVEHDRLIVDKYCNHTLNALYNYRWDSRKGLITEKAVHDDFSHMADALRYALYSHRMNVNPILH